MIRVPIRMFTKKKKRRKKEDRHVELLDARSDILKHLPESRASRALTDHFTPANWRSALEIEQK